MLSLQRMTRRMRALAFLCLLSFAYAEPTIYFKEQFDDGGKRIRAFPVSMLMNIRESRNICLRVHGCSS